MSVPKPGSWIKPTSTPPPSSPTPPAAGTPKPKKPFVRKPNLTDRPFKQHEGLSELRDSLRNVRTERSTPTPGSFTTDGKSSTFSKRRTPSRRAKTDNKGRITMTKKENN